MRNLVEVTWFYALGAFVIVLVFLTAIADVFE